MLALVHACETHPVTEPVPDPSVAAATGSGPQADLDCGRYGNPCDAGVIVASPCRDVWQEKNDDGVCVCKYEWMEKDEDGWCVNVNRPDDDSGNTGGNNGEESEDDSISYLVKVDCKTGLVRGEGVTCAAEVVNGVGAITYEWSYEPEPGTVRIWDHGTDFEFLQSVSEKSSTSKTWRGTAVHGGTVTVQATDEEDNTDEATTDFTVKARGWKIDSAAVNKRFERYSLNLALPFIPPDRYFLAFNTNATGSPHLTSWKEIGA